MIHRRSGDGHGLIFENRGMLFERNAVNIQRKRTIFPQIEEIQKPNQHIERAFRAGNPQRRFALHVAVHHRKNQPGQAVEMVNMGMRDDNFFQRVIWDADFRELMRRASSAFQQNVLPRFAFLLGAEDERDVIAPGVCHRARRA